MTITVTVNAKGVKWSRTASIEVDTAQYQQGDVRNTPLFGSEGTATTIGLHSFAGHGIGIYTNKARGAVSQLMFYNSAIDILGGVLLPTYLPFILYAPSGTGFTGAMGNSASSGASDVPDEDVNTVGVAPYIGTQNTQALVGLKAIS